MSQPSTALDQFTQRNGTAEHLGQATAIEQSRAIAEVQAAVIAARHFPRMLDDSVRQMREACSQRALADRAFFRYRRAGTQISGPSVHLARELARCFGNFQHGVNELRRDDRAGESEVQAFAWDVENNSRASRIIIVPHERDVDGGRKKLDQLRDVQEMIANQGARVVREMILDLLPEWYVEEAKEICNRVIAGEGSDKPLTQRIADTVASFENDYGVTKAQLEEKIGRRSADWVAQDLATLRVVWTSLRRGETTRQEEFNGGREGRAQGGLASALAPPPASEPAKPAEAQQEAPPADDAEPEWMDDRKRKRVFALLGELGVKDRDAQLDYIERAIGRRPEHRNQVTADEAARLIEGAIADLDAQRQGGEQ